MAIQMRRGDYTDFDPSQLLDGELAVVLENDPDTDDGTGFYVSFGDDNVKRVVTSDETANVPIATTSTAGIVKPDGTNITVAADGTIDHKAYTARTGYPTSDQSNLMFGSTFSVSQVISNSTGHVTDIVKRLIKIPSDLASTYSRGLMSSTDKTKLDGIEPSDTAPASDGTASAGVSDEYARADHVHPTDATRAAASDLTAHTGNTTVHVTAAERAAWDGKASTDTATTSANGLMSASDKSKLDGIGTKANGYYTTEKVNGDTVLTMVYDLVEE